MTGAARRKAEEYCSDERSILRRMSPVVCRFLDAGMTNLPRPVAAGVQKAPRHEVAGGLALAVLRALWGFDSGAGLEDGCNTDRMRPADQPTGEIGSV
jgi:hypothetical protein